MQRTKLELNPFFGLLITLGMGLFIGLLCVLFIAALNRVELLHESLNQDIPLHLLLIPLALAAFFLIRRNTLYFPSKVAELNEPVTAYGWSPVMFPFHYLGTVLSHLAGVSVGREGAVVLSAGGLVRLFRLSWDFWGPVMTAIAFASVVGQYWCAPFFMFEMYGRTSLLQKLFAFIGAVVAVLTGSYFQISHFFPLQEIRDEQGFFGRLMFLLLFGIAAGTLMKYYKQLYYFFSRSFQSAGLWLKLGVSLLMAGALWLPEFRKFQSLGLSQLQDPAAFDPSFISAVTKLFFTLLATSLGFLGGEFIPLVYAGVHFGGSFFNYFGHSSQLGALFGAFVMFAGATRFKWTALILMLGLGGFNYWFWAYFVMAVAVSFSGPDSLYKKPSL